MPTVSRIPSSSSDLKVGGGGKKRAGILNLEDLKILQKLRFSSSEVRSSSSRSDVKEKKENDGNPSEVEAGHETNSWLTGL